MSAPAVRVIALGPEHAEAAAALHAACFATGWSASGFRNFLSQPEVYGFAAADGEGALHAVALARSVAGEAELLTLATAPQARRRGLARELMHAVIEQSWQSGAQRLVLEVSARNQPARALYRRCGFLEIGIRHDYYASDDKQDAYVMALSCDQTACGLFDRGAESCSTPPEA